MTDQHKEALKLGRKEARAVKTYLDALGSRSRGRPVTRETVQKRISDINVRIAASDDALKTLDLIQMRLDLEDKLSTMGETVDMAALEAAFIKHARSYGERKGITYPAWREAGVPAATLKAAGVPETRRRR